MASVAPSPEVVVERSVVAGRVVEGGAGDVVVAGSLVAGPVVAGSLVTGQPHVEQPPQHYCNYCNVWMSGSKESVRRHEEGARHKDCVAKKEEGNSCYGCLCCARCEERLNQYCSYCPCENSYYCGELLNCCGEIFNLLSCLCPLILQAVQGASC